MCPWIPRVPVCPEGREETYLHKVWGSSLWICVGDPSRPSAIWISSSLPRGSISITIWNPAATSSAPFPYLQRSPGKPTDGSAEPSDGDGSRSLGSRTEPSTGILLQWNCWSYEIGRRGYINSWGQATRLANYWGRFYDIPENIPWTHRGRTTSNRLTMLTKHRNSMKPHMNQIWKTVHPSRPTLAHYRFQVRFTNWQPSSSTFSTVTGNQMQRSLRSLRIPRTIWIPAQSRCFRRETWLTLPAIWQLHRRRSGPTCPKLRMEDLSEIDN